MAEATFAGPEAPFHATVHLPGDKSLSHRALILAAMADGTSVVSNLAPGDAVAGTRRCLAQLGVDFAAAGETRWRVTGPGVTGWLGSAADLDAGNSGTTMRLLTGAVAGRPFRSRIVGDRFLSRRPMARLVAPLAALGARVTVSGDGTPPVVVEGGNLHGADVALPLASAQVRTAVALAALQAEGPTTIDSPPGYRDHTERWLAALHLGSTAGTTAFQVHPGPVPTLDLSLPSDPSSAAFLWAAAALTESSVTTPNVSLNPGRVGMLDVLAEMGVDVARRITSDILGDPVGDVTISGPATRPASLSGALVTRCLDEIPLVALVAASVDGVTTVAGAAELRAKESDRIASTATMLRSLGAEVDEEPAGMAIRGGTLHGGVVDARGDHRIAMAGAVAATAAGEVTVNGVEAAAVSWPGFAETLEALWSSR